MSGVSTNGLPNYQQVTGAELIAVDSQLAGGVNPESGAISLNTLGNFLNKRGGALSNFRNFIDGGDFTINPWQRGATFSTISNTLTYTADRFFVVGGASSSIGVTNVAVTDVPGFSQALRFQRTSTTSNTVAITLGQTLETADSIRAQGQQMTLSFWATAGANFSAANSNITVQLVSGTGTNQSSANLATLSWSSSSNVISTAQALTTTVTRYEFTGTVPTTATQLGVLLSWTPVGTAGTNDWAQFEGIQLEITSGAASTTGVTVAGATAGTVNATGSLASAFEHRDVQVELEIAQRYFFQLSEGSSGVILGTGASISASTANVLIALPVQMRTAPTVTTTIGTIKVTNSAGTGQTITTLAAVANGHTVNGVGLLATTSGAVIAGQAALLVSTNVASGSILASAEF